MFGFGDATESSMDEYTAGKTGNRFRVSCLVKKKNLKKHNSHQWFMCAFAEELRCKYIFCTVRISLLHMIVLHSFSHAI